MRAKAIYIVAAMLAMVSCTKNDDLPTVAKREIQVEVVNMQAPKTRVLQLNDADEIIQQGNFALSSYLKNDGTAYFENAWVYYFIPENASGLWRFRDTQHQNNLINFYWPNDDNINFVAYIPREAAEANGSCVVNNIKYDKTRSSVIFDATLPTTITDKTAADREAENTKLEFVYAARLNQGKDGGDVKLRFVHPFAAIRFGLTQSHRDLTIHWIKFTNIAMSGTFSCGEDTYAKGDTQDYLSASNWTPKNEAEFEIVLEKNVPNDINYDQLIGGPYLVMPQALEKVNIVISYTWDNQNYVNTIQLTNSLVSVWNPGKIYTYNFDLGDNKSEMLFEVTVEPWAKGEDDGYENSYDVE